MNCELEGRLAQVERENRRMKRIAGLALLGVISIVLMGQAKARESLGDVRADSVEIVGEGGKTRALLGAEQKGASFLFLYDQAGKLRSGLAAEPTGLELYDQHETCRLRASLRDNGTPTVELFARNGKRAAGLVLTADDQPAVVLYDGDERLRSVLGVAILKTRLGGTVKTSPSSLVLFDEKGTVIHRIP